MTFLSLIFLLFTAIRYAWSSDQRHILGALKTVSHHKLEGHQLKTLKGSTLLSCAQSCLTEPNCVSTNFGVSPVQNKLVCELNDHRASLMSNDELIYAEGFVFSVYSETFQTSGFDMKVRDILFTLRFIFADEKKRKTLRTKICFLLYENIWLVVRRLLFLLNSSDYFENIIFAAVLFPEWM